MTSWWLGSVALYLQIVWFIPVLYSLIYRIRKVWLCIWNKHFQYQVLRFFFFPTKFDDFCTLRRVVPTVNNLYCFSLRLLLFLIHARAKKTHIFGYQMFRWFIRLFFFLYIMYASSSFFVSSKEGIGWYTLLHIF